MFNMIILTRLPTHPAPRTRAKDDVVYCSACGVWSAIVECHYDGNGIWPKAVAPSLPGPAPSAHEQLQTGGGRGNCERLATIQVRHRGPAPARE